MAPNADTPSALRTASLLAAPIVAIVARLVWTPLDDDDPLGYISAVASHTERTEIGALLMIASALLLIPAAFALAAVVRDTSPRVARATTAMIVTGAVAMACMSTVGLFAAHLARDLDEAAAAASWDRFFSDETGEFIFLGVVVGAVGFLALATSLYRSGLVPRAAAVLSGLGGASILITTGGPVRPLLVAAAAVALAGFGWIARSTSVVPTSIPQSTPAVTV